MPERAWTWRLLSCSPLPITHKSRWIQFPTAAVLLLLVPNDPESGAIYVYDRRDGVWYWVDFEDQKYSGYNLTDLEVLLERCCFLRLVENPACCASASGLAVLSSRGDRT